MNEEKVPMIYAAICGVMEDVGAVGKGDYNKSQGFKYRGIDAVMNALNPAMIKHKIFCTPEVLEQSREERTTKGGSALIYSVCRMRYRFFTTDGSYVDAVVVGEGMDSGDKATNKAMAVAFKYACFQTFCIPTENLMDDPDKETPEESTRKKETSEEKKQNNGDLEMEKLFKELENELIRTGYGKSSIIKTYKVDSLHDMSKLQLKDAIGRLKKCTDKKVSNEA
mgnify:FL=1